MVNASASRRAVVALGVVLGLVTLATAPAHALLTQDGRIVWNFDAEGGLHGTLDWGHGLPTEQPVLTLSGPAGSLTSLSGQAGILAGASGNDELISQFFFDNASLGGLLGVTGPALGPQALLSLSLTDTDGIAFDGAPPIPGSSDPIYRQAPVSPPSLALFEQAGISTQISLSVCPDCGIGFPTMVNVSRNLTALPEPPPAALLVCALAAAMGLRQGRSAGSTARTILSVNETCGDRGPRLT
jgi:hypothetical protein